MSKKYIAQNVKNSTIIQGDNNIADGDQEFVSKVSQNFHWVAQNIETSTYIDSITKEYLISLFEQLRNELIQVPSAKVDKAEGVSDAAKDLADTLSKSNPQPEDIQTGLEKLKRAAKAIAGIIPSVLTIADKIIIFVTHIFNVSKSL